MTETKGARLAEWFAAGLFCLYAVLLFGHRGPPSLTDTANWTYQGVLLREHLLGHADAFHVLKRYPVPNSTATVGIGLLALALPWGLALKCWLCLQLAACFGAMRFLLRTVEASWVSWVVMPQAVFLNVNFWYGFLNFELGIACVLVVAALLLRGVRRPRVLGAMLLLAFFTHMIAFCFCGLLVGLWAWQTGRWRVLWQGVPAILLTAWYVLGRFLLAGNADGQAGMEASVRDYSGAFWLFKVNSYLKSFGYVNPESVNSAVLGRLGLLALFTVNALVAGVVLWALVRAARAECVRGGERGFLWVAMLLMMPVYVFAPGAALGISDPGARVLQVALGLGLALIGGRLAGLWKGAAGSGAGVLAVWGVVLFGWFGFAPRVVVPGGGLVPERLVKFGSVPNEDQDYFYSALDAGDLRKKVFPTALFLNGDSVVK